MLNITWNPGSDFVHLAGRFDGAGAAEFDRHPLSQEPRSRPLVLDLAGVDYLSSAGIRSLLLREKKLRANGARLALLTPQPVVMQALEMSGLLQQFAVLPSTDAAHAFLQEAASAPPAITTFAIGLCTATFRRLPGATAQSSIWGLHSDTAGDPPDPGALVPATLNELPLAIGRGGFGNTRAQALESLGPFITLANTVILSPDSSPECPDFLQAEQPEAVSWYVANALSLRGTPLLHLKLDGPGIPLGNLAAALPSPNGIPTDSPPPPLAFLLQASQGSPDGVHSEDLLLLGWIVPSDGAPALWQTFQPREWTPVSPSRHYLGYGLRLAGHQPETPLYNPSDLFAKALSSERFLGVASVPPSTILHHIQAWIFTPGFPRPAADTRLKIEINGSTAFPDEWDLITRRIYTDSSRVVLTPLSGGYSATTMRADSFDHDGRRTIPTVLKISSRKNTESEVSAYHDHVKKFILNNSTVIMGNAAQGPWAGLRYNFVGVNGPGSSLSWLADHFARRPAAEVLPLFDTVFGQILWPWYGQPKPETMRPYAQHDPSLLFPGIPEQAEKILGISADDPVLPCPELERDLPNPYHFLRHEFPRRMAREYPWLSSITHGDLNLNNILIDEKENIYVIDFSETRPRNVLSDFARIEPVITLQMTRLDGPGDMHDLLQFMAGLASVSPLADDPPLRYSGSDPMVEKAWQTICLLRRYARKAVAGDNQPLFYWLPLLEWTLPSVYFVQLSPERKRLWMLAAALLCEQLQTRP